MRETYKMAKEIKEVTGLNFLERNRKTEYVEARSFFVHILKNYYKYRNKDIINIFNDLGFAMDSATLCHSLKMFEVYERNNVRMQEWFENLFEKPNYQSRKHTQAYIKAKLKYLPEDVLIKLAAMIDTILREELSMEELEKVTWEW